MIFSSQNINESGQIYTNCSDIVLDNKGSSTIFANGLEIKPGSFKQFTATPGEMLTEPINVSFIGTGINNLLAIRNAGKYQSQESEYPYLYLGELEVGLDGTIYSMSANAPAGYKRCRITVIPDSSATYTNDQQIAAYRYGSDPDPSSNLCHILGANDVAEFTAAEIAQLRFDQYETGQDAGLFITFYK